MWGLKVLGAVWRCGMRTQTSSGCKMQPQWSNVSCSDRIGRQIMHTSNLPRYKRLLLAKLDEVSASNGGAETLVPGAGGPQGDPADQANSDTEAELQIRVHQSDAHLLQAIEDALARIRQGTFGVCQACKQPISKARLEAVPWTRGCRECKEREHT